jgi:osmotically-inducible protein OsmY
VHIDVRNGRAYLYGRVDSYYEKEHAEEVAARQEGVIDVENRLLTGHWRWKPDWEITEDIESQFFWSVFVYSDEIEVTVDDGVATLSGKVSSWNEQNAAIANAYEGGAKRVISELDIDYSPPDYAPPHYGYPYPYYP